LRRRFGAAPPQTFSQLYRPAGRTGLVSLAELGRFALLSVGVVAFVAIFAAAGYSGAVVAPAAITEAAAQETIGTSAPDFSLPGLDGANVSLAQLKGKPTVINFWATWCPPCKEELPELQQSYRQNGRRVNFLAISVKEERETVSAFVESETLQLPVALDTDGAVADDFLVRGLPTTVFLNADGVITARHLGGVTAESLDAYLGPLLAAE
jgi:thiol-disulfide isomerase/thioredoxin